MAAPWSQRTVINGWGLLLCWRLLIPSQAEMAPQGQQLPKLPRKLVIGVDGGTESIRACCFDAHNGKVVGESCAIPYRTYYPQPGWAEQEPADWYENLGQAVRGALASLQESEDTHYEIAAMAVDTTCCSVVALDREYKPLRRCLLWMDQRSAPQTKVIMENCYGDPALSVNCGGNGPVSAEWMTPKSLWIHDNEPEIWKEATTICEYQDYINYMLTGVMCASSCNAASRWHWNGEECVSDETDSLYPGRPLSLYAKLGIEELVDKLPRKCFPMGAVIAPLTAEAAAHLGLPEGTPVVQGGPDAFVGMIGLGCVNPGQLCLITGSSHLHCVVTAEPATSAGIWGAYRGAPIPGINFAEGGQSSTGSLLRWARTLFGDSLSFKTLDDEAAAIAPGADGLIALETFQGSRTPVTDPMAKGAFLGLTLSHTRAHVWRALMEAVCFGTRACVDGLARAGHRCDEIIVAGGSTRSNLWLHMHADIAGKPVVVCENSDAPLLGCAILASVGVGIYDNVQDAVRSMVRTAQRIEPDVAYTQVYDTLYKSVYSLVADAARPVSHAIQQLRDRDYLMSSSLRMNGGAESAHIEVDDARSRRPSYSERRVTVSPSLLACDWSDIRGEINRCMDARATHFHIDIFDGVFLNSPMAFTFGPQMVAAIKSSCDRHSLSGEAFLDLHVCVDRPDRFVPVMAASGANRFIFQWEAMLSTDDALGLASRIRASGMECGVSLNPQTDVDVIYPLLSSGLVNVVDILAVEPGFGGQKLQYGVIPKVQKLHQWRQDSNCDFAIMVDGGVTADTASELVGAGADILVAGTYVFRNPSGVSEAVKHLLDPFVNKYR